MPKDQVATKAEFPGYIDDPILMSGHPWADPEKSIYRGVISLSAKFSQPCFPEKRRIKERLLLADIRR
jgi:hypothetical protein